MHHKIHVNCMEIFSFYLAVNTQQLKTEQLIH